MGRNVDPGRREGDNGPELLPSLALGYFLTPFQGSQAEAAASLRLHFFKNVQSPAIPYRGCLRNAGYCPQRWL